jgi:flavin reductase (DIM6/NTAB) family NADH-FMN oxidoreductase RutF
MTGERMSDENSVIDRDSFIEALAHWATGVTVVACRDDGRVIATTVSAFLSLSLDPPLVLLALAPNATVRPFLSTGAPFAISMLGVEQRRLATIFADPYPVGPDPFAASGDPIVQGAMVGLACTVSEVRPGGDHAVVIAAVRAAVVEPQEPVIRFRRAWRQLAP